MRTRDLITAFAIAVLALCACVPKDGPPLADWPKLVKCADGVGDDVVPTVTRILIAAKDGTNIGDAAKAELADLGQKHGYEVVACAVDEIRDQWTNPGATQSPERMQAVARAKDFLDEEEITIVGDDAGAAW